MIQSPGKPGNRQERASAKESARNAADAAQKVLADFTETTDPPPDSTESDPSGTGTGRFTTPSGTVGDRVAAAIRARVEAALAERKKKEENRE